MEWTIGLEAAALIMLLLMGFLAILWGRRRWLSSQGGVFDCALKLGRTPSGWALGMARYHGDELQWFRIFSASFRPRVVLKRAETSWGSQRIPEAAEQMLLFTDHQVVELRGRDRHGTPTTWELAMTPASVTGLMSWLEASPPGGGYEVIGR
ncbi:DUF2550 domain-containing protein [Aestuariimicrobium sp. p3-SID1156]|uniref:DUF2550 domain-containing protein n=1 Tax=Aestuariimicrobium sp. p3-SID1156 TaxID=2916038 RepID=UPI00223BACA6|nr:DUF2550 domain-containing protein [Aestuariimicrobium sp. p3-SID1156]MCT1459449.1 DUF2550 domain-containing protein [Aestuariimicrobium sp. p3-SID1156]